MKSLAVRGHTQLCARVCVRVAIVFEERSQLELSQRGKFNKTYLTSQTTLVSQRETDREEKQTKGGKDQYLKSFSAFSRLTSNISLGAARIDFDKVLHLDQLILPLKVNSQDFLFCLYLYDLSLYLFVCECKLRDRQTHRAPYNAHGHLQLY